MIKRYTFSLMGMTILIGVISVSLVSADTSAVIDFEALAEGSIVSSLSCGSGITCPPGGIGGTVRVNAHNPNLPGSPNAAMIFDAECLPRGSAAGCSGGDTDLFFPGHGKTLIVAERLNPLNPDDADIVGAFMEFDFFGFTGNVTIDSIDVGDVEEIESVDAFINFHGGRCSEQSEIETHFDILPTGNNNIDTILIGASAGIRDAQCVQVRLNGSGTVDNIKFTVGPTPAPAIDIEKATNGEDADLPTGPVVSVGSKVNFTYLVTNKGNVALTSVTVVDNHQGVAVTCPRTTLAVTGPESSMTCTASTTATPGQYANIGKACGFDAAQKQVCAEDLSHHFGANPAITIEKKTNGEDADGPNDTGVPKIAVGDEVTWTYTVTSTGNVPLADVFVEDDNGTPNTSDDFSPTFVSGDVNGNDLLDLDEIWEYTASDTAIDLGNAPGNVKTVEGCGTPSRPTYQNKGVATGNATGTTVSAFDLSHYCNPPVPGTIDIEKWTKIAAPSSGGDVCDTFGKPKQIKMRYTGDNVLEHTQASGKVIISGQLSGQSPVYIIASKNSDGGGSKFFDGTVNRGEQFVIDGTASKLGAQTYVLIYNHQGGARLKSINFHTSCSQPLVLGNRFGGIQLIGFSGEKGNSGPFDPAPDFGVDADTPPTGPSGPVGDGVTWTYFVTNPGTTPLHNVAVTDDNGTPGNPADDFSPLPVMGDDNGDHILDLDETWLYQKTGTVKSGQYKNIGQVSGVDPHGNTVRDQDPSHHIGVFPAGDICEGKGKLQTLTMRYTGGNTQDHSQAPGKVKVSGDPGSASPVRITVGAHFNGTVNLGEDFVIDATGSRLGANTKVLIKDQTGKLLQEIDFHTSCSQPLERGDRFGAIQVINATSTR